MDGDLEAAAEIYRNVLRVEARHSGALHMLGVMAYQLRRERSGGPLLRARHPTEPDGSAVPLRPCQRLRKLERGAETAAALQALIRLDPRAEFHVWLSTTLCKLARYEDAYASAQAARGLAPDSLEVLNATAIALGHLHREAEAADCLRRLLELYPDTAEAHANLALIQWAQEDYAGAAASSRAALRRLPDLADAHYALGLSLKNLGDQAGAEASLREAVRLRPDYVDAHHALAAQLLGTGQLEEGWREYEWRWRLGIATQRGFAQPLWQGEPLGDRVLLLHAEQGMGDTLQFCRFIPQLAGRGRIILEVQPPLCNLLTGLPGVAQVVATGEKLPGFDLQCPLLSLPRILGTTLATIPAAVPYLRVEKAQTTRWQRRMVMLPSPRVGLVWAGNPNYVADTKRSMPPDRLAPLAELGAVTFVSLQKPATAAADLPPGLTLFDWTDELLHFADTAALIEALDLVIGVDTAVVHLAGALGKPVWLLNRFDTCWRWLHAGDGNAWYPTLRQFRQSRAGDWDTPMRAVVAALRTLAG